MNNVTDTYHIIAWGKRYAIVPSSENKAPQLPPRPIAVFDSLLDAIKKVKELNHATS